MAKDDDEDRIDLDEDFNLDEVLPAYVDPQTTKEYHQERLCRDIANLKYVLETMQNLKTVPGNEYLFPEIDNQLDLGRQVMKAKRDELDQYSDA